MASERTDELYKVLLDRGYPKEFCAEIAPPTNPKLSSYLVYYNTLNISLSFYFSLIRKEPKMKF